MVDFRAFKNFDPPGITNVWNEALVNRGAVRLRHASPLEHFVFARPYFDPQGLIVALDGKQLIGFVHCGFGPTEDRAKLDHTKGVISALAVRPDDQRKGVGGQLLQRGIAYLKGRGAVSIQAGNHIPMTPFYMGLYGGSAQPGVLSSDVAAASFLGKHRFQAGNRTIVVHRKLKQGISIADGRFPGLRKKYEVRIRPRMGVQSWWNECSMGPIELVDFRLEDKSTNEMVAYTSVWEMDGFASRWNQPAVGIYEINVLPEFRRQACGKFLLGHLLKYLQEQYFEIVEAQVDEANKPGQALLKLLGFEQVDEGFCYTLES